MGMSASQVRFLSLQSRKNDVGRQLMSLSNRKMSLSRDMNKVSQHYTEALNQKSLKWSNDAGATYNNLSYDLMMKPNDANFTVPYIVSDAVSGEVILNDDDLGLTGKNGNIKLSYTDIAKMISSYSGVDDKGKVQYANQASYTDANGIVHGAKAQDNAYYIPDTTKDFSFDNCLRYDIFLKMGLIDQEDYNKQVNLLTALYGSASAQKDGVYPVGSAWGDYYIAQANLEAYDALVLSKRELSNAGTFTGTGKPSKTYIDKDGSYTYKTDINGTNGSTSITQTTNNGAMSHIDFSKVVEKDAAGNYDEKNSGNASAGFFNKYQQSYTDETTDGNFSINVSQNGINYNYTFDDMLHNALSNYYNEKCATGETDEYKTFFKWMEDGNLGQTKGDGWDRYYTVYEGNREYYIGHNNVYSKVKPKLEDCCDKFINLLSYQKLTSEPLDSTALQKAKVATVTRYRDTWVIKDTDACEQGDGNVTNHAQNEASKDGGLNGVSINHQQIHYHFPATFHGARIRAVVDLQAMFNTFMTYYNHYATNPDQKVDETSNVSNYDTINFADSTSTAEIVPTLFTSGSTNYSQTKDVGKDENDNSVEQYIRTEIQNATYGDSDAYRFTSSGLEQATFGQPCYKDKPNAKTETLTCRTSGSSSIHINDTIGDKNVYGTMVQTTPIDKENAQTKIYYFLSQSALNDYKNNGSISTNSNEVIVVDLGTQKVSISAQRQELEKDSKDTIILNERGKDSSYDIKVNDYVKEDAAYRSKLATAVDDAMEHIKDLEEDLKNVYGGADKKLMDYYDALFQRIAENGWKVDEHTSTGTHKNTASKYLNNKLQNNDFFVTVAKEKADETGYNYTSKLATSVTKIFEVNDDNAQNQALSKYESDKALISNKEAKIDAQMQKLETEQEAINTEMESVQKIVSDNIDKTFKMFA